MSPEIRTQHDLLMAFQPEGADHDSANCPVCAAAEGAGHEEETLTTYSEEQAQEMVAAAVAAAVSPLQAELAGLRNAATAGETETKINEAVAAAVAPLQEELTAATAELTKTTADLNAVTEQRDGLIAAAEAAENEAALAAELEETRLARVAAVAEVAHFTDEQVAAQSPQWAAMDEPSFGVMVETLKSSAATATPPRIPVRPSALTASEVPVPTGTGLLGAALAHARDLRAPRTV